LGTFFISRGVPLLHRINRGRSLVCAQRNAIATLRAVRRPRPTAGIGAAEAGRHLPTRRLIRDRVERTRVIESLIPEESLMDLIFVGIFVAFFAASVGLIHFCAKLMGKERP
jgi:hypothetical protein